MATVRRGVGILGLWGIRRGMVTCFGEVRRIAVGRGVPEGMGLVNVRAEIDWSLYYVHLVERG